MSIFETASRKKLRFETVRGHLTAEQLWSVPLNSTDDFNLDAIASKLDASIKEAGNAGSFFGSPDKTKAAKKALDELRLEIVKRIYTVLSEEEAKRKDATANKAKRQKFAELLAKKRDEKEESLTEEQIMAELAKLGDESEG